jgi:hypothetical protein
MTFPKGTGANQENQTYGALAPFAVSGTLSWSGTGTAPTSSDISFTATAGSGTFGVVTCTGTSSPYSCSATFTPTASDAVGTYAINISFSGDTNYSSAASVQTQNYSINQATPTFGTMSFSPAASEPFGTAQAITISDTLAYTGAAAPTGAVKFNLNGANHTASCTGSSSPLTCTATVTAVTIEALAVGAYSVTATSAADTNYAGATGTPGTFTITQATVTPAMITPRGTGANQESQTYGALAAFSVSGQVAWSGSGTVPTVGDIMFTTTAAGAFSGLSCTGSSSPYSCTATFTPTATDAVGTYAINISFSGDTNYSSAVSAQTANYAITQSSPTATMTSPKYPSSTENQTYGELAAFSVSGQLTFTGNGAAPTVGDLSFTSTAAGASSGLSCSLTSGASPYVCTATFTPTSTDVPGNYAINLNFSGDTNYASSVSGQTQNYAISKQAPTPQFISPTDGSPVTQTYGSQSSTTVHARLLWIGNGAAPAVGDISFTTTDGGTFTSQSCTLGTLLYNCTATFNPNTADAVGDYALNISFTTDGNYSATHSIQAMNYIVSQATTAVSLVASAPGSSSAGTASTNLTATMSPAISGATVTFTDATTGAILGSAMTTAGVATLTGVTSTTTGVAAGLNNITASVAATTNYTAATSTPATAIYLPGILVSTDLKHDFSGLITDGSLTVEGTLDGTKLGPFGIVVTNFTSSAQATGISFANAASGAFSYATNCPASLAAGATCNYAFYYDPPYGDGCTVNGTCTLDSSGYQQGTYESATWQITVPSGIPLGINDNPRHNCCELSGHTGRQGDTQWNGLAERKSAELHLPGGGAERHLQHFDSNRNQPQHGGGELHILRAFVILQREQFELRLATGGRCKLQHLCHACDHFRGDFQQQHCVDPERRQRHHGKPRGNGAGQQRLVAQLQLAQLRQRDGVLIALLRVECDQQLRGGGQRWRQL